MSIKSFTKTVSGIGPVLFERSRKAKSINITIKPFEGIRVAVPFGLSYQQAERVLKSKRKWVEENIQKIKQVEHEHDEQKQERPQIDRAAAREQLVKRLEELSAHNGFSYNRVFVRCQKTKWGSCSSNNNINLNAKLVELPDNLIDYVIYHELVHLNVKNHGPQFWAELDKYVGDAKALDKELKKYRLDV